jgi:hypothetical protein
MTLSERILKNREECWQMLFEMIVRRVWSRFGGRATKELFTSPTRTLQTFLWYPENAFAPFAIDPLSHELFAFHTLQTLASVSAFEVVGERNPHGESS